MAVLAAPHERLRALSHMTTEIGLGDPPECGYRLSCGERHLIGHLFVLSENDPGPAAEMEGAGERGAGREAEGRARPSRFPAATLRTGPETEFSLLRADLPQADRVDAAPDRST
ncbi:hypothetical protein GCM10009525_77010 [Streptosporangium amethystogenes subsp. fukuiense]